MNDQLDRLGSRRGGVLLFLTVSRRCTRRPIGDRTFTSLLKVPPDQAMGLGSTFSTYRRILSLLIRMRDGS